MKQVTSLYIHFPYCRHLCNYCDFYKTLKDPNDKNFESYHSYLNESFKGHTDLLSENGYDFGTIKTLYIGGGTPSMWGKEGAQFLKDFLLKNKISLDPDVEFTVEFNPGNWNEEKLQAWQDIGANRYSLGIQSLNDNFLEILDRVHRIEEVKKTLFEFNKRSLNFSVDFMLGLPQSKALSRDIISELTEILTYNPAHISLYILTVGKQYKHFDKLPEDVWISEEYNTVSDFLISRGYDHYEVSNFAKPGYYSEHNLEYWKSNSVAALGPSATGLLTDSTTAVRYKWKPSSATFETEKLNQAELALERLYLKLRTNLGVQFEDFKSEIEPIEFKKIASRWTKNGLSRMLDSSGVVLTSKGFLILDSLMDDLFLASK